IPVQNVIAGLCCLVAVAAAARRRGDVLVDALVDLRHAPDVVERVVIVEALRRPRVLHVPQGLLLVADRLGRSLRCRDQNELIQGVVRERHSRRIAATVLLPQTIACSRVITRDDAVSLGPLDLRYGVPFLVPFIGCRWITADAVVSGGVDIAASVILCRDAPTVGMVDLCHQSWPPTVRALQAGL